MSAAFSGPSRGLGIEVYRGARAYFDEVNAHGGVDGRPIVIKAYDDGYNPAPAIYNTIRAIEQDQRVPALRLRRHADRDARAAAAQALQQPLDLPVLPLHRRAAAARAARTTARCSTCARRTATRPTRSSTRFAADRPQEDRRSCIRPTPTAGAAGTACGARCKAHQLTLAAEATYERGTPYATHLTGRSRSCAPRSPTRSSRSAPTRRARRSCATRWTPAGRCRSPTCRSSAARTC